MAIFTEQVLQTGIAPALLKRKNSTQVALREIVLANSESNFSFTPKALISIPLKNGVPTLRLNRKRTTAINVVACYDEEVSRLLAGATDNFPLFAELLEQNQKVLDTAVHACQAKNIIRSSNSQVVIYQHDFPSFMRSLNAQSNPQYLTLFCYLTRTKIQNNSYVLCSDIVSQTIINGRELNDAPNIVDLRTQNYNDYLNFDLFRDVTPTQEAYFSDQYNSYDENNFLKFLFMWDKIQFLREKSNFGAILDNTSITTARQKMIDDSLIVDMKIIRKRVKKSFDGYALFSKNSPPDVIVTSHETSDDGFLKAQTISKKTKKVTGEIASLTGIKGASNKTIFLVNDYAPSHIRMGLYQYEISAKIQDGMLKFLLDSQDELRKVQEDFTTFSNNFSASPSTRRDLARTSVESMLTVLFSLAKYGDTQMAQIRKQFATLLNTLEGVAQLVTFNQALMVKISDALGKRGIVASSGKEKSLSKNTSNLYFLETRQEFSEIINFADFNSVSYDYYNLVDNLKFGAAAFDIAQIRERFFDEFKKVVNYDGEASEINFADLNNKLYSDNLLTNKNDAWKNTLFQMDKTYFAYLSPKILHPNAPHPVKSGAWSYKIYNDDTVSTLAGKGLTIENRTTVINKAAPFNVETSEVMGDDDKINNENTYSSELPQQLAICSSVQKSVKDSASVMNGIAKQYNNFNFTKADFDLNNASNFIALKDQKSSKLQSQQILEDMPNHMRALFGSRSESVVNKWALTENDFLSNPDTINMIKENYSNLIKIEVLVDFDNNQEGQKIVKLPKFKKLEISDIENLKQGEFLFCRTFKVDDKSMGIGMKNSTTPDTYYNKHFIISLTENILLE